jgi:hypothetical protein
MDWRDAADNEVVVPSEPAFEIKNLKWTLVKCGADARVPRLVCRRTGGRNCLSVAGAGRQKQSPTPGSNIPAVANYSIGGRFAERPDMPKMSARNCTDKRGELRFKTSRVVGPFSYGN